MFKTIMLLFAAAIPLSSAQAKPAWDVAARWICRGDRTAQCDNAGTCKNGQSRAMFEIDFATSKVTNLSTPNSDGSTIALRKFSPAASYDTAADFKGVSFLFTAEQQAFLIEEKPTDDILEPYYRLRMVTSYSNGDTIHYGTCIPRKKAS